MYAPSLSKKWKQVSVESVGTHGNCSPRHGNVIPSHCKPQLRRQALELTANYG